MPYVLVYVALVIALTGLPLAHWTGPPWSDHRPDPTEETP